MSENSTFSPVLTGRERTAVPAKSLSFVEGVSMIVGTNIGAGVLSIAYASSKAGFLPLLFWLVLVGSLTTVTMLYVAESTLRMWGGDRLCMDGSSPRKQREALRDKA